jgi:hypothetical protein
MISLIHSSNRQDYERHLILMYGDNSALFVYGLFNFVSHQDYITSTYWRRIIPSNQSEFQTLMLAKDVYFKQFILFVMLL